jgi:hypothetical protein
MPGMRRPAKKASLRLVGNKAFKTGIVLLEYAIEYAPARLVAASGRGFRGAKRRV